MTDYQPPTEDKIDRVNAIIKGGLASLPLPVVSGVVAEIFGMVVQPGLTKRQKKWMERVAHSLSKLEDRVDNFDIESLKNNDEFLSVLIEVTQCAIKTHQEEKLAAFQNIIENSIFTSLEFDYQKLFLIYVSDFTIFHIEIMKRISDFANNKSLSFEELQKQIIKDICSNDSELYEVIREELEVSKGLIKAQNGGYLLSNLGISFMEFISKNHS